MTHGNTDRPSVQPQPKHPQQPPRRSVQATVKHHVDALTRADKRGEWIHPDKRALSADSARHDDPPLPPRSDTDGRRAEHLRRGAARGRLTEEQRIARAGGFFHEYELRSLLDELHALRDGYAARRGVTSGARQPGSRTPPASDVADLLTDITVGAYDLHRRALRSLNRERELLRLSAGRLVPVQPPVPRSLAALVYLVDDVDIDLQRDIERSLRSWVAAGRLLLGRSAPMATLEYVCPLCRQQTLTVRSDASSDVICINEQCADENGRRPRWPRDRWVLLLTASDA